MNESVHIAGRLPYIGLVFSMLLLVSPGCGSSHMVSDTDQNEQRRGREVPLVSGSELRELVKHSDGPLLVEFGVNFGCFRCDEMRPQLAQLASEVEDRAKVVRVDFNANRSLAGQYGAN